MSTSPSYRRKKTTKKNGVCNTDANHYLDVFRLMSTLQVTCVNDRVTCVQQVTHRLEISFGYAKHYLDVFRLMSNLQVTCVDVCQRSRNVPPTYGQRMRNVCHTSQNFKHAKICRRARRTTTYASVLRRIPAYYDVYQHASACS